MHTLLNVFQEHFVELEDNILVLLVTLNELDQEDVRLLHHLEVRVLVLGILELLVLDDLDRDVVGAQVAQQSLVLLVEHVIVREDALVFIVPLLVKL